MKDQIPFVPRKALPGVLRPIYPASSVALKFFHQLETDLQECESMIDPKEYLAGALFALFSYFLLVSALLCLIAFAGQGAAAAAKMMPVALIFGVAVGGSAFCYILLYPRMLSGKRKNDMEQNLLFATRHMMVQTSAGVPIFDSMVSISQEYGNATLDYGAISREFREIVKEVRSGQDLALALEASAEKNPSQLYRRMMLQLSNATRAGANVSLTLRELVSALANEQQIGIRKYGSQLNTLAMFYIFACIVAPALFIIFLTIAATLIDLPVGEPLFALMLVAIAGVQIMFIGLIKSRRPVVAL